ncbi:MAG: GAF domain-containing protein [Solirubrobacteraceae bacterium]
MSAGADGVRMRRLFELGRALVPGLDQPSVLARILEAAREITGARYAALGILDEQRVELAQFRTVGLGEDAARRIGDLPRGHGVLGVLISDPRPLRLADVTAHARSCGFPADHPPMRTFLGVPIEIAGEAWGNLYLTDKEGGEFTAADEEAAVVLANWTATAIEAARLHETSERRREDLERAVRGLESIRDVALAIGGEAGFERVLDLIAVRGRALIESGSLLVMLRDGEELVLVASAGDALRVQGLRLSISDSTSGQVFERGRPERIADVPAELRIAAANLGVPNAHTGLLVPMLYRGRTLGVLAAFDSAEDAVPFTDEDEQLLGTFAAAAANAVAVAQHAESDRLRSSIAAADAERGRWARELHDETLQGLGALRIVLAVSLRRGDAQAHARAMGQAIDQIGQEIENLRGIIADLRPAALDELGLGPAIEALLDRRGHGDFEIVSDLRLPDPLIGDARLGADLETTVYRLVQEALTNVAKHARARLVHVAVVASDGDVEVEVRDDGVGFGAAAPTQGFGLAGMRERVDLAGGALTIASGEGGTRVHARLRADPVAPRGRPA